MPAYRCEKCGEQFFERSQLAALSPCPECGREGAVEFAVDNDGPSQTAKLRPDRRAEIRTAAEALLEELGITSPPVDVAAIASELGYPVAYTSLGNVDGDLRNEKIRVNQNVNLVRQRYTIAHEIGHLRLHPGKGASGVTEEREAQQFAGALLIPPTMLRKVATSERSFEEVRRRFKVSGPALSIAIAQANLSARICNP